MTKYRYGATSSIEHNDAIVALGSSISDAAQLKRGFTAVGDANGTKGVKLPHPLKTKPGDLVIIKGTTSGVLKVYPGSADTGAKINGLADGAEISLASGLIPVTFIADSALQWYTLPLVAS